MGLSKAALLQYWLLGSHLHCWAPANSCYEKDVMAPTPTPLLSPTLESKVPLFWTLPRAFAEL